MRLAQRKGLSYNITTHFLYSILLSFFITITDNEWSKKQFISFIHGPSARNITQTVALNEGTMLFVILMNRGT